MKIPNSRPKKVKSNIVAKKTAKEKKQRNTRVKTEDTISERILRRRRQHTPNKLLPKYVIRRTKPVVKKETADATANGRKIKKQTLLQQDVTAKE